MTKQCKCQQRLRDENGRRKQHLSEYDVQYKITNCSAATPISTDEYAVVACGRHDGLFCLIVLDTDVVLGARFVHSSVAPLVDFRNQDYTAFEIRR